MITEAELRDLTRNLDEYDAETVRYLAAAGVTHAILRRVLHMNKV